MKKRGLALLLLIGVVMSLVGCGNKGNKDNGEETPGRENYQFEMESVSPTENFDIEKVDEINSGLVRVNKKISVGDIDASVSSKVFDLSYNSDLDKNIESMKITYYNGLELKYTKGVLTQVYGKKEDVANVIDDEKLVDYLFEAAEKGIFSYVSGDTIWYMFDGKYESSMLDTSCYIYVIESHSNSEGDYITIGLENSDIKEKEVKIDDKDIKKEVKKIYEKVKAVSDDDKLLKESVRVQYDELNNSINYIGYSYLNTPEIGEIEVDFDGVEYQFENNPKLNKENGFTEENGFKLDKDGYVVDELPYGFQFINSEDENYDDKNGADIYDYIVSNAKMEENEILKQQAYEEELHRRLTEELISSLSVSRSGINIGCKITDKNKSEYESMMKRLEKLGEVTLMYDTETEKSVDVVFSEE